MERDFKLNIYKNGKVIKTVAARKIDLTVGTVRKLSKIVSIDKMNNTADISKAVFGAWERLTEILNTLFPDITDEEWDGVKINEMITLMIQIGETAVKEALLIPTDEKKKNP